jgi:hypothetical protein
LVQLRADRWCNNSRVPFLDDRNKGDFLQPSRGGLRCARRHSAPVCGAGAQWQATKLKSRRRTTSGLVGPVALSKISKARRRDGSGQVLSSDHERAPVKRLGAYPTLSRRYVRSSSPPPVAGHARRSHRIFVKKALRIGDQRIKRPPCVRKLDEGCSDWAEPGPDHG